MRRQRQRLQRPAAHFPAQADRLAVAVACVDDRLQRPQVCRRQGVETRGNALVVAIRGEKILGEIVRADRQEIGRRADFVELPEQRGNLHHRPQMERGRQFIAVSAQEFEFALRQMALAWVNSQVLAIIGNMMRISRPAPARSMARSCIRSNPGRSSPILIARQPSAGFSSSTLAM